MISKRLATFRVEYVSCWLTGTAPLSNRLSSIIEALIWSGLVWSARLSASMVAAWLGSCLPSGTEAAAATTVAILAPHPIANG